MTICRPLPFVFSSVRLSVPLVSCSSWWLLPALVAREGRRALGKKAAREFSVGVPRSRCVVISTGNRTQMGHYEQRRKKVHSYRPPLNVFGGIWRSFDRIVCNSLRTSREPVGEAPVNTITMTCWSRDRADDVPGITRKRRRECRTSMFVSLLLHTS